MGIDEVDAGTGTAVDVCVSLDVDIVFVAGGVAGVSSDEDNADDSVADD